MPDTRGAGFIGDLEIGQRYSDETVFRRVIVFDNPTNTVERTTLALSVTNGKINLNNYRFMYIISLVKKECTSNIHNNTKIDVWNWSSAV